MSVEHSSRKVRAYFFKDGCLPRVYVNPTPQLKLELNRKGIVLLNPNIQSVKGLPLHHCMPCKQHNLLKPLPLNERLDDHELVKFHVDIKSTKINEIDESISELQGDSVLAHTLIKRCNREHLDLIKHIKHVEQDIDNKIDKLSHLLQLKEPKVIERVEVQPILDHKLSLIYAVISSIIMISLYANHNEIVNALKSLLS